MISRMINVVDCRDIPLEPTYQKRARQLVKNRRAEWISEDTIRMKLQYMEETIMAANNIELKEAAEDSLTVAADNRSVDDETIMELAKRRLAIKKNLLVQTLDYILLLLCFGTMAVIWDYETQVWICIAAALFWGGRLLYRIFKFAKPSFKEGIAAYLKKRSDYKLESEFNRLKKEYLNNQ